MIPARWKTRHGRTQHRDPGCARIPRTDFDAMIRRGDLVEMGKDEAVMARLNLCAYCFSAAGYVRFPNDVPVDLPNLDVRPETTRR